MKSKKILSLLLLFAISFSVTHDYTFAVLDNNQHSVQEYVSKFKTPSLKTSGDMCDIHFEFHISYLSPAQSLAFDDNIEKRKNIFMLTDIFHSWNYFSFFKPPIA